VARQTVAHGEQHHKASLAWNQPPGAGPPCAIQAHSSASPLAQMSTMTTSPMRPMVRRKARERRGPVAGFARRVPQIDVVAEAHAGADGNGHEMRDQQDSAHGSPSSGRLDGEPASLLVDNIVPEPGNEAADLVAQLALEAAGVERCRHQFGGALPVGGGDPGALVHLGHVAAGIEARAAGLLAQEIDGVLAKRRMLESLRPAKKRCRRSSSPMRAKKSSTDFGNGVIAAEPLIQRGAADHLGSGVLPGRARNLDLNLGFGLEGNGQLQLILDEATSEDQRKAAFALVKGEETEPGATIFNVFSNVIDTYHEPLAAPVEIACDIDARTARISVPGIVEATGEPIRNPVTGAPHRARVTLPGGFEYLEAEYASSTVNTGDAAIPLAWTKGHAHFARVTWTPQGVIA
jgi:hypothetical protein